MTKSAHADCLLDILQCSYFPPLHNIGTVSHSIIKSVSYFTPWPLQGVWFHGYPQSATLFPHAVSFTLNSVIFSRNCLYLTQLLHWINRSLVQDNILTVVSCDVNESVNVTIWWVNHDKCFNHIGNEWMHCCIQWNYHLIHQQLLISNAVWSSNVIGHKYRSHRSGIHNQLTLSTHDYANNNYCNDTV